MGTDILEYAWVNKGFALIRQSKYDEAIKAFDKAIELNPQYADAWSNKGVALYDQGKFDEAIKAFDEAIKLNPQDPIARYAKGLVLQKLGHRVERCSLRQGQGAGVSNWLTWMKIYRTRKNQKS